MISANIPLPYLRYFDSKQTNSVLLSRYAIYTSTILFHVYVLYFAAAWFRLIFQEPNLKLYLAYMFYNFISYALWYTFNRQWKRTVSLYRRMQRFHGTTERSPSARERFWLTVLTLSPFGCAALDVYFVLFLNNHTFYSLGYRIEDRLINSLLTYLCSYGYFWIYLKWPCVALWSVCHLIYKGGCILRRYNDRLKDDFSKFRRNGDFRVTQGEIGARLYPTRKIEPRHINSNSTSIRDNLWMPPAPYMEKSETPCLNITGISRYGEKSHIRETLMMYFHIIKMIRELKDVVSIPSLLLTMMGFTSLYTFLADTLLGLKANEMDVVIEMLVMASTGSAMVISLSFLGAMIPKCMSDIRITCGNIIVEACLQDRALFAEELALLERIEKIKEVIISASDLVVFKKRFVLTSFASLLTFGLLILSLKIEK